MTRRAAIAGALAGALGVSLSGALEAQGADRYAVVPRPARLTRLPGELVPGPGTRVWYDPPADDALRAAAAFWLDDARLASGQPLADGSGAAARDSASVLLFRLDSGLDTGPEGYRLDISPRGLVLEAATAAGIFYGAQTLRQLSPPSIEAPSRTTTAVSETDRTAPAVRPVPFSLPAVHIEDTPRFPYRGLHLDVGRHLFPVEFIERYIDLLARFKLNTFHWHLTDDQGWRIEIEGYPRLTEVGAWRSETLVGKNFDPYVGDGRPYGGFYTGAEVREVVAYAAARHVTVIPEIEMPGHSLAALAAYPELACTEGPFEVGTRWGVFEDIYCPSERTFDFLEDVLAQVMELFPSPYIHIGGDEVPKTRWRRSAVAQGVMREHGLGTEEELQGWFIQRIERFLAAHGRRLLGWDEILEGGLPPDATVMSWRGIEGGIEAARQGHDVVMTPGSHLYFDHYQSRDRRREPLAIGGFTPLDSVYAFEPIPAALDPSEARHILGAQANLWTEYIRTPEQVEYMVYPRALALAEVVWTPRERRSWEDFVARLPAVLAHLERSGVPFRIPTVRGLGGERLTLGDRVTVRLSSVLPGADIRYTLDGSDPIRESPRYEAPIPVSPGERPVEVRARVFLPTGRASLVASGRVMRAVPVPPAEVDPASLSPGLRYEVAAGSFVSVDQIASADLERRARLPGPGFVGSFSEEAFGLRFSGYLEIPATGVYTFHLTSDDGSRLAIAGRTVVDNDGLHAATEASGQIALEAGLHPVEVLYFEAGGGEALALDVTPPEGGRRSIPPAWWWSPD